MMSSLSCFKTYDVRGKPGNGLGDDGVAYHVLHAYAQHLNPLRVIIGGDLRKTYKSLIEMLHLTGYLGVFITTVSGLLLTMLGAYLFGNKGLYKPVATVVVANTLFTGIVLMAIEPGRTLHWDHPYRGNQSKPLRRRGVWTPRLQEQLASIYKRGSESILTHRYRELPGYYE